MIQIDIRPLKPGTHLYEWDVEAGSLNLDASLLSDLHIDVKLDFHPAHIFVTMQTHALAHLVCDRTLVDFVQPVEGEYRILYSGSDFDEKDGAQHTEDDIRYLPPDADEIDLTDLVRDTFMLSLPYRRIAPGAEAEDIPLQFGVPDEKGYVDPRWEALRGLSSEQNDPA